MTHTNTLVGALAIGALAAVATPGAGAALSAAPLPQQQGHEGH